MDSGVATRVIPGRDLRITSVSLGYIVANQQQRTTLQLTYRPQGMEEALKPTICSLLAGKVPTRQCSIIKATHYLILCRSNKRVAIWYWRPIASLSSMSLERSILFLFGTLLLLTHGNFVSSVDIVGNYSESSVPFPPQFK